MEGFFGECGRPFHDMTGFLFKEISTAERMFPLLSRGVGPG